MQILLVCRLTPDSSANHAEIDGSAYMLCGRRGSSSVCLFVFMSAVDSYTTAVFRHPHGQLPSRRRGQTMLKLRPLVLGLPPAAPRPLCLELLY